ncbi:TonB-denpendent receptor [Alcanivorax sp. P2S70]|uniref:TonB-dependent receptor domain-containing protein n=1 Tax=Alcanivorax sp. P2S70 TaxID=1397527 RepID=UPI0003B58EF6|nr:TonB-dependent receptor [Alcanivorax sp. P2S70]ERP88932.1 TonB-denpendent receptor [Alcanivorax sp. P2S70]
MKKGYGAPLLAGLVAGGWAMPAMAEENQAHELGSVKVVSAAGYEQKITDAPASISVISQEELHSRPFTSAIDAVRELEGVDVGETRDKTGQSTISMRGMGADYTLILIDGRRQNNHGDIYPNNFGGNQFNHIPPLEAIERIEVIRGPASTLYGADAMGGVINIITKKNYTRWGGGINVTRTLQEHDEYGDSSTTDFSVSGPLGDQFGLAVRGSLYDQDASNPEYAPVTDPNGVVQERELGFGAGGRTVDNEDTALGFTLRWTPTDNQRISLDYDNSVQTYDNSESQLGTHDSPERLPRAGYAEDQEFTREQIALTHEGEWGFGFSNVSLTYLATNNEGRTMPLSAAERAEYDDIIANNADCVADAGSDACLAVLGSTFLPRPQRKLESNELRLDGKLDMPVNDQHLVVVGTQILRGELEDGVFGLEGGDPGEVSENNFWALYAEDNWTIVEPFTLTTGVRYDNHETFGDQISPRLYGVYQVRPGWTVKGGVSTGYKTPKTTDLYDGITGFGGQGTRPWVGNPDLEPETSVNSEIALYWESPNRHNANITLFQNDFKDKISRQDSQLCSATGGQKPCVDLGSYESVGGIVTQPVNVDKAVIKGVEVAGRYQISPRWSLRANYTYIDSEQKSGDAKGYPLTGSARHMLNGTLDWQTTQKFGMFLTVEGRHDRFRGFGRSGLNTDASGGEYWKDYEIYHLGARLMLNESVTLHARVNNLLDEDFTTYDVGFVDDGSGGYDVEYYDDYNNKDARRNFWIGLQAIF